MKSNLTQTLSHFGAAFHIQIAGTPKDVAAQVNRLHNFGIITAIDENYKEGIDHIARVNSYTGRFERGIRAMARVNVRGSLVRHGVRKPSNVRRLLSAEVAKISGGFRRIENTYSDMKGRHSGASFPVAASFGTRD